MSGEPCDKPVKQRSVARSYKQRLLEIYECGMEFREDVLAELLEISTNGPEDIRCHDHDEAENERAFDRLLVSFAATASWQSCGIAMHRQPQHSGFRMARLDLRPSSR